MEISKVKFHRLLFEFHYTSPSFWFDSKTLEKRGKKTKGKRKDKVRWRA